MTSKQEKQLYIIGWILLMAGTLAGAVWMKLPPSFHIPCVFKYATGLYCPGCGGTRAVTELLHGHFGRSLWYHPVVGYTAALYVWFMVSHTLQMITGGRWAIGMKYHNYYLYIALGLILAHFLFSNALLLIFHIPL